MARARARPVLSVAQAFVRCQEGVSGHQKFGALLWQALLADQDAGWDEFRRCVDLLLCAPQVRTVCCTLLVLHLHTTQCCLALAR